MLYINNNHTLIAFLLVLAASAAAAISDVRTRRIPNALVIALFVGGLFINIFAGAVPAALDIAIAAAVLLAGTVAFSFRLIGGGDVKLLAAAAGTLGFPLAVKFVLFTFIAGGLIAILFAFSRGKLRATFANVRAVALPLAAGVAPERLQNGTPMPYALAICAGAVLVLVTSGAVPQLRVF